MPVFVSPPVPEMVPLRVAALPLVSNVPPPALSVIARPLEKPALNCSVPPPKVSPLPATPRLLSAATASVPPLIVAPTNCVTAFSVSVPLPVLTMPPVEPPKEEDSVTLLPLVSKVPPAAPTAPRRAEMSVEVPVAHCRPPPFSVIVPVPRLFDAAKLTRPPFTAVLPE